MPESKEFYLAIILLKMYHKSRMHIYGIRLQSKNEKRRKFVWLSKKRSDISGLSPQIVPADQETTVTIQSLDPKNGFQDGKRYRLRYFAVDRSDNLSTPLWREQEVVAAARSITFTQRFYGEQEHYVDIEGIDVTKNLRFSIYSLAPDLFGKVPMKGDFHMHSNNSDGADYAPHVPAMCRKIGFDFMALTDHRLYAPSLEAIAAYEDVPMDLIMMPGEEVHPEGNNVHMINFGAKISINDYMREHPAEYAEEVQEILRTEKSLQEVSGMGREICASCIWCFRKIRENGGLGIFCHPFWYIPEGCQDLKEVNEYLFRHTPQDAEELVGGYYKEQTFSNDPGNCPLPAIILGRKPAGHRRRQRRSFHGGR